MAGRRRYSQRPRSWHISNAPVAIRVGSRRNPRKYHEIIAVGPQDANRFARLVDDQTHINPNEPLIVAVNGYQPWLQDVLDVCIDDNWADIADLGREVMFATTMQFPEKANKRSSPVPWTFIIDQMNVPQVYYWSVNMEAPEDDDNGLPMINRFRFRIGVWQMGRGACTFNRRVPVIIIFTLPTAVCEHVVRELMFPFLYKDTDFAQPREDEEGICWTFSRLYWLLSDWQNIIAEVNIRLKEAEENSHGRRLPVKLRTRLLHVEVDRIYELKEFLHFHSRSFKKLQKLKSSVPQNEQKDPLWDDMDDAVDDLDQFDGTLDSLKERFNNLIDFEFNIQSAVQADNGQFLSTIATLFLPISFLAGVWGFTTTTLRPIWYVYVAVPIFIISAAFTAFWPWFKQQWEKWLYPIKSLHIPAEPRQFTMLGEELPDAVNVPGSASGGRSRRKGTRPMVTESDDSRSRRRAEKADLR